MTRTVAFYVDRATKAFEAGFTSKAGQKSAASDLNSAADLLRAEIHDICFKLRGPEQFSRFPERAELAYWMNTDLHLWNAKRHTELLGYLPEAEAIANEYDDLAALRGAIKASPVVKVERQIDEREIRIQKSVRDLMELRKSQYERGLKLHDLFDGLPVHGNVHYVTNQHGTSFTRTFYYLNGSLTPLNVILAILDTKAREAEAAGRAE